MSEIVVTKIVFGILLSIGTLVLMFLAFKFEFKYLFQEKRCTSKVKGKIIKYSLLSYSSGSGASVRLPIVQYEVEGKEYKVKGPEYSVYKSVVKKGLNVKQNIKINENGDTLETSFEGSTFGNAYKNPLSDVFEIGNEIDVFYDPKNPKNAFVLRYCNKKWWFYLMFFSGVGVFLCDIYILFFLK